MLFHDLVATSLEVTRTAGRLEKIGLLARCMSSAAPHEIPIVISYLSGSLRQGRIGIGLAKVWRLGVEAAAAPSLTLSEVDGVFCRIGQTAGSGSSAVRADC